MSGSQSQMGGSPPGSGTDPSMEDILASIRRILSEEDNHAAKSGPSANGHAMAEDSPGRMPPEPVQPQDVLLLDNSMLVRDAPPRMETPKPPPYYGGGSIPAPPVVTPFAAPVMAPPMGQPVMAEAPPPPIVRAPEPPAFQPPPPVFTREQPPTPPMPDTRDTDPWHQSAIRPAPMMPAPVMPSQVVPAPVAQPMAEDPAPYAEIEHRPAPSFTPPPQAEFFHREPPQAEPAYREPAYHEPPPVYHPPVQAEPVREAPVYQPPVHFEPVWEEPVYEPPAYHAPAEPVQHAPVHLEPAPVYQPPEPVSAFRAPEVPANTASPSSESSPMSATLSAPPVASHETTAAAAGSISNLVRALSTDRAAQIASNGPTVADIVREEMRPMLKAWLDNNLPTMVEKLVRAEIDRVVRGSR